MILRPNSLSRHSGPPSPTTATPALPIPTWLRRAVLNAQNLARNEIEDVAVVTGAAIGALDAVVRRQERWGGAWLADALVAQRLGWTHAVPLLGAEVIAGPGAPRPRRSGTGIAAASIEDEGVRAKSLLTAQARAA
ncbi:MAG: hypothetical protein ACTHJY_01520, partial [Rhizobiaceae bacterium]